jgi:hypothetical protein
MNAMNQKIGEMSLRIALVLGSACAMVCMPEVCPQAGCASSPWIFITDDMTADGRLRAGAYGFALETDYAKVDWTCTVDEDAAPDPACNPSLTAMGELDGQPVFWFVKVTNGPQGVEIELLEVRDEGSVLIGPAQFSLAVTRDGALQAEESYSPTYIGRWINGEGCDPYCASVSADITLELPG